MGLLALQATVVKLVRMGILEFKANKDPLEH